MFGKQMRAIPALLSISLFVVCWACHPSNEPIRPRLGEARGILKIYNSRGKLVLTKEVKAYHYLGYGQLYMEDTLRTVFAGLYFSFASGFNQPGTLRIVNNDSQATFMKANYPGPGDWQYQSVEGILNVDQILERSLEGYFDIAMKATPGVPLVIIDGQVFGAHSEWGETIRVKGYFNSKQL